MTTLFYGLLIISVIFYLGAFLYETWVSFARLKKSASNRYAHATWEITHTILVMAIVAFFITHSAMLQEIAKAAFIPLFVVVFGFLIRGVLYLILFFDRDETKHRIGVLDYLFALSHVIILGSLAVSVVAVTAVLLTTSEQVNTSTMGWYVWGFVALIVSCIVPLIRLYRIRN